MKILVVHAHHEPKSFCAALASEFVGVLRGQGHDLIVSDLYRMGFDPVSDRRNFSSAKDPTYLKQQAEEQHAFETDSFNPALDAEIRKLEWCDALVFSFPLWWFGMPAILKGWVDRVFAMGRIYGFGKLYEQGIGAASRRAMVVMTTGGGPAAYGGRGVNPSMREILAPVHHGVFWFNGFLPLDPFVSYSPARKPEAEREADLAAVRERAATLFTSPHRLLPRLADFPQFGEDTRRRFIVTLKRLRAGDRPDTARAGMFSAELDDLERTGLAMRSWLCPDSAPEAAVVWMRAATKEELMMRLSGMLGRWSLSADIVEVF